MIPLVKTGGSPREIGHDVGTEMRETLRAAIAATREGCTSPSAWDAMVGAVGPYLEATEREVPEILDEMRGMAEASGVPLTELMAHNAAEELDQAAGRFGCTVVGVTPAGSVDGHVLLGHNEDTTAGWADYAYVIHAEPATAPAFVAFTYAGYLLHQGLNAAGLGSVGNALYARDARVGIPKLLLYRRALIQRTLEEAIRSVTDPARGFGNNHLFANAEGDIYDVEVSGNCSALLHAGNGFLAHANHFVSPELAHLDRDDDLLNSRLRQNRVERLAEVQWGALSVDVVKGILADHSHYPRSVCKHHAPESDLNYGTIGSVVIDVTDRMLWACAGNPCRATWRAVEL